MTISILTRADDTTFKSYALGMLSTLMGAFEFKVTSMVVTNIDKDGSYLNNGEGRIGGVKYNLCKLDYTDIFPEYTTYFSILQMSNDFIKNGASVFDITGNVAKISSMRVLFHELVHTNFDWSAKEDINQNTPQGKCPVDPTHINFEEELAVFAENTIYARLASYFGQDDGNVVRYGHDSNSVLPSAGVSGVNSFRRFEKVSIGSTSTTHATFEASDELYSISKTYYNFDKTVGDGIYDHYITLDEIKIGSYITVGKNVSYVDDRIYSVSGDMMGSSQVGQSVGAAVTAASGAVLSYDAFNTMSVSRIFGLGNDGYVDRVNGDSPALVYVGAAGAGTTSAPGKVNIDDSSSALSTLIIGAGRGASMDDIKAGSGNDIIIGTGNGATVRGGGGHDVIVGTQFADSIFGDDGDDLIVGSGGGDYINGGAGGYDILSYSSATDAIWFNVTTGRGTGGIADHDIVVGIERIIGSSKGDKFVGGPGVEVDGGAGSDEYLAGDPIVAIDDTGSDGGIDVLDFWQRSSGVIVDLKTNTTIAGDTFDGIEKVLGTTKTDKFFGYGGSDVIIDGSTGVDTMDFSRAAPGMKITGDRTSNVEIFVGTGGSDTFQFNDSMSHTFVGGGGADTASYADLLAGVRFQNGQVFRTSSIVDTLTNVSTVLGTKSVDNFYAAKGMTFDGGGGADNFYATTGSATYRGTGQGVVSYANSAPLIVDLTAVSGIITDNIGNTYSGVATINGSWGKDTYNLVNTKVAIRGNGNDQDTADFSFAQEGLTIDESLISVYRYIGSKGDDTFVSRGYNPTKIYDGGGGAMNIVDYGLSSSYQGFAMTSLDPYVGIQKIKGSDYADALIGGKGITVDGGKGGDTYYVGTSAGIFADSGNSGNDTLSLAKLDVGSTVNVSAGTVSGGTTFQGIESFVGSSKEDVFVFESSASGSVNINGGGGRDILDMSAATSPFSGTLTSIEEMRSGSAADVIYGLYDLGTIYAGGGNDTINTYTNVMTHETVFAESGDDTINGSLGNDVIDGGSGTDTLSYASVNYATLSYDASSNNIQVRYANGSSVSNYVQTIVGIEKIVGGIGSDTFTGASGDRTFDGGGGDDLFAVSDGKGYYVGGGYESASSDRIDFSSTSGALSITFTNSNGQGGYASNGAVFKNMGTIIAGSQDDYIDARNLSNTGNVIRGGIGNDTILHSGGYGTVYGDDGNDTVILTNIGWNSSFIGGAGSDTLDLSRMAMQGLTLNLGESTLSSGSGYYSYFARYSGFENFVFGQTKLYVVGTGQSDVFSTGEGEFTVIGGAGNDVLTSTAVSAASYLNADPSKTLLTGNEGDDTLQAFRASTLEGGIGNDTIQGSDFTDIIRGGAGNDVIFAGGGKEVFFDYDMAGIDKIDAGDGIDSFMGWNTRMSDYIFGLEDDGAFSMNKIGTQNTYEFTGLEKVSFYYSYSDTRSFNVSDALSFLSADADMSMTGTDMLSLLSSQGMMFYG